MKDQKGQNYENVTLPSGALRVTYIPDGWPGVDTIRFQIEDEQGHLPLGPEVPIASIGQIMGAIVRLLHSDLPPAPMVMG